ncbi:MAG TPA: hypothetical protein VHB68_04860 [Steroidobacteraceae bacterium]|nr:hypothetical protein [Steroidobacteraceae bacterium]
MLTDPDRRWLTRRTFIGAGGGYKIGGAGIGAALLHTHLAVRDRYAAILFPDNPFPRTQRT